PCHCADGRLGCGGPGWPDEPSRVRRDGGYLGGGGRRTGWTPPGVRSARPLVRNARGRRRRTAPDRRAFVEPRAALQPGWCLHRFHLRPERDVRRLAAAAKLGRVDEYLARGGERVPPVVVRGWQPHLR